MNCALKRTIYDSGRRSIKKRRASASKLYQSTVLECLFTFDHWQWLPTQQDSTIFIPQILFLHYHNVSFLCQNKHIAKSSYKVAVKAALLGEEKRYEIEK